MFNFKNPALSHESYVKVDDDPSLAATNFPPREIFRRPDDHYPYKDEATLETFTYPANIVKRDYQYDIAQTCFRMNTLVCLPTGAGKTLIAAVAMMNFHRWYPRSKIIFVTPTRHLADQQFHAVLDFTNIPKDQCQMLVGSLTGVNRNTVWDEHSVFFATSELVRNDIEKNRLNPTDVSLLILDEAHHAHRNHAYAVIVRQIAERTSQFRVIGLSATPGSTMDSIQCVIYNLLISKIVYRDNKDIDISKYQKETNVEFIKVPLGSDENTIEAKLCEVMQPIVNDLVKQDLLNNPNPKTITKGSLFFSKKRFQETQQGSKLFFLNLNRFGLLYSLANLKDRLTKYGATNMANSLRDFRNKKSNQAKEQLINSKAFIELERMVTRSKDSCHPKLVKLTQLLDEFFGTHPDSRCIVFTQFRNVATEISNTLKLNPRIKSTIFIGKSNTVDAAGLGDVEQLRIVELFKRGDINTIVATCVAEEGLDIGEVDLIVCYDSTTSPLQTVQRMGRTGRKRNGRVVFLLAEGVEEKTIAKAQSNTDFIRNKLTKEIDKFVFYQPESPVLPLPQDQGCIMIRCVKPSLPPPPVDQRDLKKPELSKTDKMALDTRFGPSMRYRKINLTFTRTCDFSIISSSLLSRLLVKLEPELPPEENNKNDNVEAFKISDDDEEEIIPQKAQPTFNYIDDTDDDFDDIVFESEEETPKKDNDPRKILISDSSSDGDMISSKEKIDNTSTKSVVQSYIDDTDDDIDFFD